MAAGIALALLVGEAVVLQGAAAPSTPPNPLDGSTFRFGMDMGSVDGQSNQGVHPDFGMFWAGVWNLKHGWGGVDWHLDTARSKGVTPSIQFYYWGDDISPSCVQNGCWSDLHGGQKDRAGWQQLAQGLADRLNARLQGAPAVIILESEFNKGGVQDWEPFDGMLAEKARFFKAAYPASIVVLGFGSWGEHAWGRFDQAAAASDMTGLQAMRGSTRDSLSHYYDVVTRTRDGAQRLSDLFGKPVLLTDLALSSYPEPTYAGHQEAVLKQFFERLQELKDAGIRGVVYRSLRDNPSFDPANYYGYAERYWGFVRADSSHKPSMKVWVDGVKAERAGATPPPPPPPPPEPTPVPKVTPDGAAARVEAEAFAQRSGGGTQNDAAASQGKMWNQWSNGAITQPFLVTAPGVVEVRVTARGDALDGVAPRMEVQLGGQAVLTADVPAGAWKTFSAWVPVGQEGEHALRVAFTNDARHAGGDRNLLVDKAEVEWMGKLRKDSDGTGIRIEAEDFNAPGAAQRVRDKSAAGGLALALAGQGQAAHARAMDAGLWEVRVVAKGTPQDGTWPELELRLDGVALATRTVAKDDWTVVTAQGSLATGGTHEVGLAFVNDAAPSGSGDRSLTVDRIALQHLGAMPLTVGPGEDGRREVEDFSRRDAGTLQVDPDASGDAWWRLPGQGAVGETLAPTQGGVYEVRVAVQGRADAGTGTPPRLEVRLDGNLVLNEATAAHATRVHRAWLKLPHGTETAALELRAAGAGVLLLDKAAVEWLGGLPVPGDATTTRVEAEDFSHRGEAKLMRDSDAAGGLAVRLAEDGAPAQHRLVLPAGSYHLRVVARGDPDAAAFPALAMLLDGEELVTRTIDRGTYRVYAMRFTVDEAGAGSHDLGFALRAADGGAAAAGALLAVDRFALERVGAA